MQIKRLRIAGFKSFVEPADLRIEPGLTGVVGPNGCGKSNLFEALRWTMGEGSAKSLRGAGMDDVIFAGTATRPPRDFAEVSILAEIDGEETEIVRRIERGAGSAYRIDGRDVRAKDVGLLFADAATGAHSPALVSQGRIGAVIAAKPADRRAMLEEAAGISGLHVRRRDAEQKLRATEVNLSRLDELIADQDARAAALRRQARAAERYRLVSDQIRVAEGRMIFARWREAAAAAIAARTEAAAAEARVAAAAGTEREAAARRNTATDALATIRAAAMAARDHATEAGHTLSMLRADKATTERRLADLGQARRRIDDDRAREGALGTDAAAALDRLAGEIAALETAIETVARDAPLRDATLAEAERTARDAEVALARALATQAHEAAEARIAAAAVQAAQGRTDRARGDAAHIAAARAAIGGDTAIARDLDTARQRRIAAEASGEEARRTLAEADGAERAAVARRDAAEAARATARANLAAIDGEATALVRATQRFGGRDRLLDHVTAARGYERSLAAALGDDLDTAFEAWTGSTPSDDDPPRPPGTEPLANHVVGPAMLGRRLHQIFVVDADTGQPLAVGQRLVTKAGGLRRWDGFVATGSGAAAAERLERLNRLRAIKDERPAALAAVEQADADRAAVESAFAGARKMAEAARWLIQRTDTDRRDAQRAEDRAAAALERIAGQCADLDARAARATDDIAAADADRMQAETIASALPDGRASAEAVAALQGDADHRRVAVAEARSRRSTADAAIAASRERLAAARADTASWRARAGEAAKRIADMANREAEIVRDIDTLMPRPSALDARIATLDTDHAAARATADTLQAEERVADTVLRTSEAVHVQANETLAAAREGRAGAVARVENQELRRVEMGRLSGERFECPAPVLPDRLGFDAEGVRSPQDESVAHERLTAERERIGQVNLVAERELADLESAGTGNAAARADLDEAVARLRGSIGTLNREGRQRLRAAFEAVDGHFRTLFATLFGGGQAHLEMIDSDDPLEAGLEIMAQPPGKRLQSLTLLSGGEQALTAVALIFALFLTNPAPICVLDEVDAPLDDANIERFCDLLDRMSRETATRYLVVTHNAVTMSRMHRLFGVTMIEQGVSRLVSVDLQAAEGLVAVA